MSLSAPRETPTGQRRPLSGVPITTTTPRLRPRKAARVVRRWFALSRNYFYDLRRYARWSASIDESATLTRRRAMLTMNAHSVEKGLAFTKPRPGFGREKVQRLVARLEQYVAQDGMDELAADVIGTLDAYERFNRANGLIDPALRATIDQLLQQVDPTSEEYGGTRDVTKASVLQAAPNDPEAFFSRRHSVRSFSGQPLPADALARAVQMAQKTPSVCNRQAGRVHVFTEPAARAAVLAHQTGNRGFGHEAEAILVVTADLGHLRGAGERNQVWIDGGMFALSIVYALHAQGIGTCMLNWSVEAPVDGALHHTADIPDNESIIMLIAVGSLPERFTVARSTRKRLDAVMVTR